MAGQRAVAEKAGEEAAPGHFIYGIDEQGVVGKPVKTVPAAAKRARIACEQSLVTKNKVVA